MTTVQDLLTVHPFLNGLTDSQLSRLSAWAHRSQFRAGTRIFSEGAMADRFWLIRDGQVTLDAHVPGRGDVIVETLGPGSVLGWSWLFPPYRWQFDVRAQETVRATTFDGACLRKKCEADPAMGYELMKRLAYVISQRLHATRLQLLDVYGPPGGRN